jgi:hypothetical protein
VQLAQIRFTNIQLAETWLVTIELANILRVKDQQSNIYLAEIQPADAQLSETRLPREREQAKVQLVREPLANAAGKLLCSLRSRSRGESLAEQRAASLLQYRGGIGIIEEEWTPNSEFGELNNLSPRVCLSAGYLEAVKVQPAVPEKELMRHSGQTSYLS